MWRNTSETFERKEKQNPGGETCVSPPGFFCGLGMLRLDPDPSAVDAGGGGDLSAVEEKPSPEGAALVDGQLRDPAPAGDGPFGAVFQADGDGVVDRLRRCHEDSADVLGMA